MEQTAIISYNVTQETKNSYHVTNGNINLDKHFIHSLNSVLDESNRIAEKKGYYTNLVISFFGGLLPANQVNIKFNSNVFDSELSTKDFKVKVLKRVIELFFDMALVAEDAKSMSGEDVLKFILKSFDNKLSTTEGVNYHVLIAKIDERVKRYNAEKTILVNKALSIETAAILDLAKESTKDFRTEVKNYKEDFKRISNEIEAEKNKQLLLNK